MKYISYVCGILSLSCFLFALSFAVDDLYQNPLIEEACLNMFQAQVTQANEKAGLEDKGIASSVSAEDFFNQTSAAEVKARISQGVKDSLHQNLKFKLDEQQVNALTDYYVSLYEDQLMAYKNQDVSLYPAAAVAGGAVFAVAAGIAVVMDIKMKQKKANRRSSSMLL